MHPGYSGLVALAERELGLVQQGDIDGLPSLWDERRQLVAALPPIPEADAGPCLQLAAELQGLTTAMLEEHLDATGAEMRRLVRGRAVMHSYAPQVTRPPIVDHAG